MPRLPFSLTLVAAALATAVPAHAAEAKPGEKSDAPIQKIEVKGSADSYNPRRDDTATKIVVNHDEIVKYGDTNVLDVLKRVPGVTVTGSGGRGGEIRMRGLGSGYTQILIDGQKAPAGFSIDSLAPDTIERIEVMRAATAEFSTQSIAGTINIVLRKALRNAQRELKIRAGWGRTSKPAPGMNLQLSDRIGKLAYSLGVNADAFNYEHMGDSRSVTRDPGGRLVLAEQTVTSSEMAYRNYSISPRLTWTFAGGDLLIFQSSLGVNTNRSEYDETRATSFGPARAYPYIASENETRSHSFRSELNWVKKFGTGAKLDTKISGSTNHGRPGGHRYAFAGRDGAMLLDRFDRSESHEETWATSGKYSAPLGEGHSLMAGWEGGAATRNSVRRVDEHGMSAGMPLATREDFDVQVRRFAVFAQDEWKLSNQWSMYGGVRWEGSSTRVEGTGYAQSKSRTGVWSPLFQTLYKLPGRKGDQLRLALTRTYKPPFATSLIPTRSLSLNNSRESPDWVGNPRLKPEIAIGVDASYEHYWAEGAMFSISGSMREIDGYTKFVDSLGADGRWVVMIDNSGKAHTRGMELEAKFPLKAVMANAPAIDFRASLSRNWSSVDAIEGPNNRLAQQTPFSASMGADYKMGQLTTGASIAYHREGTVRLSNTETSISPSRQAADVYALWKFDTRSQVRFSVGNLLLKDYRYERVYVDRFGTTTRTSASPASLNFRVALEFKH